MKGEEALWMPGTDHAGIATQNVVEKAMAKEGLKRQDLGREKFIERVWQWREQYGSTIIQQLKRLGASCDWQRLRFTMDEDYSKAILEVFVRLYEKGLIYRGNYIINWCPRCQTALSDEEAPHRALKGNLYYLRYPLMEKPETSNQKPEKKGYIVVATTRPETMLGDTAVAVNPKDKRYKDLIGKTLILPLINREIKIIADTMVDMKFGTGAVKVTPAHDPNDYVLGKKHHLEFVNVMHPDGRMNENAGDYRDTDRFEAREVILEDLKEKGLLEKIEPHELSAGHCYRCHTIIEPYLSKQWFVKMQPLAKPAIEVVKKGKIKFYPARWTKIYLNWMENIQDWCISRQIWWGHRLPVYYCRKCQGQEAQSAKRKAQNEEEYIIVSRVKPEKCPHCGSNDIYQDEDVLDTWFSSWLWPFATFYWPPEAQSVERKAQSEQDLKYFYPTSVLVTAPEIIFFWVARMIMAGMEFMKDIPFHDVYIHGTVRDVSGKKMSKSLGNTIDPLEIIDEFGADALRFSIISITATGADIFLAREKFELGRNFCNKLWNAARFILMNLGEEKITQDLCVLTKQITELKDRWILSRFYETEDKVSKALEKYHFNAAAKLLYEFVWHEFCDWYIELAKMDLEESADKAKKRLTQIVLYKVLEKTLRILHPFMPYISEEIWQNLVSEGKSIMLSSWPHLQKEFIDKKADSEMQTLIDLITAVRNLRAEWKIELGRKINLILKVSDAATKKLLEENTHYLKTLAKLEKIEFGQKRPAKSALGKSGRVDFYLPLADLIDVEKEKKRIEEEAKELKGRLVSLESRLANKEFVKKAPKEVVEREKAKQLEIKDSLKRLELNLAELIRG
jgi:valyl-tRNA synthetase